MSLRDQPASSFFLGLALAIFWQPDAHAKTITLDDSGSLALEPSVSLRWKNAAPARSGAGNLLVGSTTVRVRINVLPWVKRTARIYLALPAQQPGPLSVSWTSAGQLQPGRVQSGNRVLVYSGPISAAFIADVLKFEFSVDAGLIGRPCAVSYHFEMDES